MFLRRFFEPTLAQTSYLVGCAAAGEAIVVDANRDVEPYVRAAEAEGARITYVTETHIHADYVSGSRELAARTGATLLLSDEGGPEWKYAFAEADAARLIRRGDRVTIGQVVIDVVHTPGHTPEHLTFLVTDRAVAEEPMGAITGDFIFVGDVGRPDLLERAARHEGTMEASARQLYRSLRTFAARPDWLQIWPGHGAGSACGKGISAVPQSTLGYERRFNWAFQIASEDEFVTRVLDGQPDPPKYFAEMKRLNLAGPRVLGGLPAPAHLQPGAFAPLRRDRAVIVDTRRAEDFAVGHLPGTICLPLDGGFTTWAGWLLPYSRDLYLIADGAASADVAARDLALIGLDRVTGYFDTAALDDWVAGNQPLETVPQIGAADLAESIQHGGVTVLDVRSAAEWQAGHIKGARHVPLGDLTDRLGDIPRARPIVVQCATGGRAAIGASLLLAGGFDQVIVLSGGISAWIKQGRPTVM